MKKILLITVIFLILSNAYAQPGPQFVLKNKYGKSLPLTKLSGSDKFSDFIPHYPHSWIDQYSSTQIVVNHDGVERSAKGLNLELTKAQQQLISGISIGDQLNLIIKYQAKNSVTGKSEPQEIKLSYSVTADEEAIYSTESKELSRYLNSKVYLELLKYNNQVKGTIIQFVVNENGVVANARIHRSSGHMDVDQKILETIQSMPGWRAAQNKDGKKFSQEFELELIEEGC